MLHLHFTQRIISKLEQLSMEQNMPLEAVVAELVLKALNTNLDPEERVEQYREMGVKFLEEAEMLMREGDLAQASEKFWGAAAQTVKAVAARRHEELRTHGMLHRFVTQLAREQQDPQLATHFATASALHQNFYENIFNAQTVEQYGQAVKELVIKLEKLL